jgi:hypothetical protein
VRRRLLPVIETAEITTMTNTTATEAPQARPAAHSRSAWLRDSRGGDGVPNDDAREPDGASEARGNRATSEVS